MQKKLPGAMSSEIRRTSERYNGVYSSAETENLFLHDNGLLFANGTDKAITWMNSTVNGHPVIPRTGYIVEFNALWYNALRFIADLVREGGDVYLADELDAQAEVTGKSFVEVFRNEYGYLLDYVDGNMMDWSVRPNMIFT